MKGHVREARNRLRVLGRRPTQKCSDCDGPVVAWDRVPPNAPVKCGRCGRRLNYIVYRWKDATDEKSEAPTSPDG